MLKKEELDSVLTPLQIEKLGQFATDDEMLKAVEKVLLFQLYYAGTVGKELDKLDFMKNSALVYAQNPAVTDKELADYTRAVYQGINALKIGLDNIAKYKPQPMPELKKNPAR